MTEETSKNKRLELNKLMQGGFSEQDLRRACFELDVDYENLEGSTKAIKIQSLLTYLENRDRLGDITSWIKVNRADLISFGDDTQDKGDRGGDIPIPPNPRAHWENFKDKPFIFWPSLFLSGLATILLFIFALVGFRVDVGELFPTLFSSSGLATPISTVLVPEIAHDKTLVPESVCFNGVAPKREELEVMKLVEISSLDFFMGDNQEGSPLHKPDTPAPFKIDKYEVTNVQYLEFLLDTNYPAPQGWSVSENSTNFQYPDGQTAYQPVVNVSWADANAYCAWDGNKRLPNEVEWELACRGNNDPDDIYPWGNFTEPLHANTSENACGKAETVGSYPNGDSEFGVSDMIGNVMEWVSNADQPYAITPPAEGEFLSVDTFGVVRGGYWRRDQTLSSCSVRFPTPANIVYEGLGFRCAKTEP